MWKRLKEQEGCLGRVQSGIQIDKDGQHLPDGAFAVVCFVSTNVNKVTFDRRVYEYMQTHKPTQPTQVYADRV